MKLIIDISENDRTRIGNLHFVPEELRFDVAKAIMNGTPLPKGHWINTPDYLTCAYGCIDYVKCSECGEDSLEEGDFCPNCGAYMGGAE